MDRKSHKGRNLGLAAIVLVGAILLLVMVALGLRAGTSAKDVPAPLAPLPARGEATAPRGRDKASAGTAQGGDSTSTDADDVSPAPVGEAEPAQSLEDRMKMVDTQIRRRGVTDQEVLDAMERVPRHEFVPDQYSSQAYNDHPLPIGFGQTISQPYIVALMTELLALRSTDRVLEIGTGSGYQAAILGEIVEEVYTVEIVEPLSAEATERLKRLGYTNIHTLRADGYHGWEEHAPFDAIIVTAAPDHIPQPLVQQLADGGKLIIPVGPPGGYQTLWEVSKTGDEFTKRNVSGVLFVPLTGEH